MTCRRCGDAISTGPGSDEDITESSTTTTELCFFCTPASWDAASDLSKIVGEKRAKSAFEVDNERIGAIDDADWERPEAAGVDEIDIDLTEPRSAPTDYFAALDEPDDFDEKAWLKAIGSELAEADRVKLGWDVSDKPTPKVLARVDEDLEATDLESSATDESSVPDVLDEPDDLDEPAQPELVTAGRRRFFGRRG